MGELTVRAWRRYGRDHLYVYDRVTDETVARYDRASGKIDLEDGNRRDEVLAALAPYLRGLTSLVPSAPPPGAESDVARHEPGDALSVRARETGEASWAVGAAGERLVSSRLRALGDEGWYVLNSITLPSGADIDHVAIGPAGVFTINTKHHRGAKVRVGTHVVWVDGAQQPYIRNSLHEAQAAERLLTRACRTDVRVRPALVFVAPSELHVSRPPEGMVVSTGEDIAARLRALPWHLSDGDRELIHSVARRRDVWLS